MRHEPQAVSTCRKVSWALLLCLLCSGPVSAQIAPDAGLPDAGLPDAGLPDAGLPDAGLPDAGPASDPKSAPVPAVTDSSPDSALVVLEAGLDRLVNNESHDKDPLERLFTVALDDRKAIDQRLSELPKEIEQLQASASKLVEKIAQPNDYFPIPAPRPPQEPGPEPEPPVPPEQAEPEIPTKSSGAKPEDPALKDLRAAWQAYNLALTEHKKKQAEWQDTNKAHQEAQSKYSQDLAIYEKQRLDWLEQKRQEQANTQLRLRIARLRTAFLKAMSDMLKPLPQPALLALGSIASDRQALKDRAARLSTLVGSIKGLDLRLETLAVRVQSGALVGFASRRQKLEVRIANIREQLDGLSKRVMSGSDELTALASQQEKSGRALRRTIIASAMNKRRTALIDTMFEEHLRQLRQLTKIADRLPADSFSAQETGQAIDGILLQADHLATVSEAEQALNGTALTLERLAGDLQSIHLGLDRWRLAYMREQVTVLSSLTSAQTKKRVFSLSGELLSDLRTDLALVWGVLQNWAQERGDSLRHFPAWSVSTTGTVWLLRLALALFLVIGVIRSRRRISGLALLLVRKARGLQAFRGRVGTLIRWAGLLQAILPTLGVWLFCYLALLLIGTEYTEVRFFKVAFFWMMLYLLGRQTLIGLTRQISRGRPALLPATADTSLLLKKTYGRLGLFLMLVAIVDKWTRVWLGAGTLSVLVRWTIWFWVAIWALWAIFAWRRTLGSALRRSKPPESFWYRLGAFMEIHWYGGFLSPLALGLLSVLAVVGLVRFLLDAGGFFSFLRVRTLKRLSKKDTEVPSDVLQKELPENYLAEFTLQPIRVEGGPVILPREEWLEKMRKPIMGWRNTRKEGSLVLIGEKGSGKTTLLAQLARRLDDMPVLEHTIDHKVITAAGILTQLATALGHGSARDLSQLADLLNEGEERVVLLDEAHNLFLRTVDGYEAFDALVRLVTQTSKQVYWLLAFNTFAWEFINQSRKRVHYFRRLLRLPAWTAEELQDLITSRNKRSGIKIEFDEVLLDANRSNTGEVELIETTEGYFRLLRNSSGGNPRVATHLWLRSLRPRNDDTLLLGLFREESAAEVEKLDRELLFALAAFCEHENLSVDELRQVLNISADFAAFAVHFLTEYNYLEAKDNEEARATLGPRFYRQVLEVLRKRHLVFEGE